MSEEIKEKICPLLTAKKVVTREYSTGDEVVTDGVVYEECIKENCALWKKYLHSYDTETGIKVYDGECGLIQRG